MRCFSIVSSPNSDHLQFAMRIAGPFTQALAQLEPGDPVFVRGPFGNFVIDEDYDHSLVLLAGGIGITPIMSMVRYATEARLNKPLTLLYSCPSQDNIPFYDELISLSKQNERFKVAFFVTNGDTDTLKGAPVFKNRLTDERLTRITKGRFNHHTYFVCGPKGFMDSICSILAEHETESDRVITEEFTPTSQIKSISIMPRHSVSRWTYGLTAASLVLGTALVMAADLDRALPKLVAADSAQTTTQPTSSPSTGNSSPATTNTPSSTPSSSSSSSTQQAQSYQAPITSVS
jgi:ferredoxin-NADP reductase